VEEHPQFAFVVISDAKKPEISWARFQCYRGAITRDNKVISKGTATLTWIGDKVRTMSNILLIAGFLAVAAGGFAVGYGLRSYKSVVRRRRSYWQGQD
jgi:hypothetical protein